MTEEQEAKISKNTESWLLTLITACPQIVKKGIGAKAFAEELINFGLEFDKYPPEVLGAIKTFLPFISICPQIFNSEIGIKEYMDELSKAAVIFEKSLKKP
jgi:hypothetical protein